MIQIPPPTRSAHTGNSLDLAGIPRGPEFIASGRCAEGDPEVWFPERGGSPQPAIKICRSCDVVAECLAWALASEDKLYGVWGGTTATQRRKLRPAS